MCFTAQMMWLEVRWRAKCCVLQWKRLWWDAKVGSARRRLRAMFALYVRASVEVVRIGTVVQSTRSGKQCAAYYWGMQLQIAGRIGRRVQRSRKGKQRAAYYWGMQLQISRRIGRGAQRSRKGKQCAAYYWGMQLQIAGRIGRRAQRSRKRKQCAAYYRGMQLQIARRIGRRAQRSRKGKIWIEKKRESRDFNRKGKRK